MTTSTPKGSASPQLPKGIYYETARKRFRVRLYKFGRVVYQTYHRILSEALASLHLGNTRRLDHTNRTIEVHGNSVSSILNALAPQGPELNSV